MKLPAFVLTALGATVVASHAIAYDSYQQSFITGDFAVLCANPYRLDDGFQAAQADDKAWLKEAGCVLAPKGWRITRISPPSTEDRGPWRVRIFSPDGEGATVWGERSAFTFPDGSRIPLP